MKNRMNVVPEAGIIAVLVLVQAASHFHVFLDDHDLLAAPCQIACANHAVVAGADHDAVVFKDFYHRYLDRNDSNDLNESGSNRSNSSSRSRRFGTR